MLQWIEQDPELLELLSGKEVALIGPAPYLINKGYGEIIDNCDLIARPNEIIPLPNLRMEVEQISFFVILAPHGCRE